MFFRLFAALGWSDKGHKRAAVAAREQFLASHPGEKVGWTEISEEEPGRFVVIVHYGQQRPKQRRLYAVDRETFKAQEIIDPDHPQNGHSKK